MRPGSRLAKIYLNHLYVVAGSEVFSAVRESRFLRETFAAVEHKTHTSPNLAKPWTALYLRGKNTYLELFENFDGRKVGDYGFAFGVEQVGGLDTLYPALKSAYPDASRGDFKLQVDNDKKSMPAASAKATYHPTTKNDVKPRAGGVLTAEAQRQNLYTSFKYILFPKVASRNSVNHLDTFVMEYTPEVFKVRDLHSMSLQPAHDISRRRYNSKAWNPNAYFNDIEAVTTTLEPQAYKLFTGMMGAMLDRKPSEGKLSDTASSFHGENFAIHLREEQTPRPLSFSLQMTLLKPVKKQEVHKFAQAQLTLKDTTAVLDFSP